MGYLKRKKLYEKLKEKRGNHIISYVTSIRPNVPVLMGRDIFDYIIEQIKIIPPEVTEIDFIIISNGGDPIVALRIISILRERFEKINVLVPSIAYSAATVLCLGADSIVMHPFSNLGPIDPQLTIKKKDINGRDSLIRFSTEDIANYINFFKEDSSINSEKHLTEIMKPLIEEIGPLAIGFSKRSQKLSISLAEKLLATHMKNKKEATRITDQLNSSYYHHGYAVSRSEAKEIGLKVEESDIEVEELLLELWENIRDEMKCEQPFDIQSEILNNDDIMKGLNKVSFLNLPTNTPPNLVNQAWQNVISSIKPTTVSNFNISLNVAVIESCSLAFELLLEYNIIAWRDSSYNLQFNVNQYSKGWKKNEL